MTYAQILAGGLSFQLYNKSTNAVVPTSVSDGGGYIEITEDATSDHNTVYKIDHFVGAVSEITLYTEGDSAKTYALLGASFDDSAHSIRTFSAAYQTGADTYKYVFVEIDGKMYLPGVKSGEDFQPINDANGRFEVIEDTSYIKGNSVFPIIEVVIEDDQEIGEGAKMKVPSIDNIEAEADNCIEIIYKEEYNNDEPWRYNQDGFFYLGDGWAIRINGVWHAIANNVYTIVMLSSATNLENSEDIYKTANPSLVMDVESSGTNLTSWKTEKESEFGITFANDIPVVRQSDGDNLQPFTNHNE